MLIAEMALLCSIHQVLTKNTTNGQTVIATRTARTQMRFTLLSIIPIIVSVFNLQMEHIPTTSTQLFINILTLTILTLHKAIPMITGPTQMLHTSILLIAISQSTITITLHNQTPLTGNA